MTADQINQLHYALERAIAGVKRTQKQPQSAKHRVAVVRVKDAREALMAAENQIERERIAGNT